MSRLRTHILFAAALGLTPLGCRAFGFTTDNVERVPNESRTVAVWGNPQKKSATQRGRMCLEYSTPASKLNDTTASLKTPTTEGGPEVELSYANSQSLAKIYTVGEVMQFGHAALYRLCEAAANGQISEEAYLELFDSTLARMHGLLRLQLATSGLENARRASALRSEIELLDARICRKELGANPTMSTDDRQERAMLVALLTEMEEGSSLSSITSEDARRKLGKDWLATSQQVDGLKEDSAKKAKAKNVCKDVYAATETDDECSVMLQSWKAQCVQWGVEVPPLPAPSEEGGE